MRRRDRCTRRTRINGRFGVELRRARDALPWLDGLPGCTMSEAWPISPRGLQPLDDAGRIRTTSSGRAASPIGCESALGAGALDDQHDDDDELLARSRGRLAERRPLLGHVALYGALGQHRSTSSARCGSPATATCCRPRTSGAVRCSTRIRDTAASRKASRLAPRVLPVADDSRGVGRLRADDLAGSEERAGDDADDLRGQPRRRPRRDADRPAASMRSV